MTRLPSKGDGMSKSVMLADGEDWLVAPSRTSSRGVVLSHPGILLEDTVEWMELSALCVLTRLEAVNQLTREICADAPRTLCYRSMGATGSDESSQNNRSEHCGLFLVSVGLLSLCNLSEDNCRTSRPYYPVRPGVHLFIGLEGRQGRNARFPCQANETKRDLNRDELYSAIVMRRSTK